MLTIRVNICTTCYSTCVLVDLRELSQCENIVIIIIVIISTVQGGVPGWGRFCVTQGCPTAYRFD